PGALATGGQRSQPGEKRKKKSPVAQAPGSPLEFTLEVAQDSIQRKALDYDPTGDTHYDVASAFIKSMRGSDPDAAIYRPARTLPVPKHLRDSHYRGAEQFGHGQDYEYAHDHEGGWVDQAYLPEERRYYEPVDRGYEAVLKQRLEEMRKKRTTEAQRAQSRADTEKDKKS